MAKSDQKEQNNFITLIVPAIITATSNKVSDDFKQKNGSTKTIYFHSTDDKVTKQLEQAGMTLYTPEPDENGEATPYFVAKATRIVKVFTDKENFIERDFTTETPNMYTDEIVHLAVMKVKAQKKGQNDFFRINSILVSDLEQLKEVEAVNPFAVLFE